MLTVDIETYHTTEYSLKRLTTEEYIRNDSFDTLGVGIKQDTLPTVWYSGGCADIRGALARYNWNQPVLAHNAFFDLAILSWIFNIRPKFILDTMLMARPKHAHDVGVGLDALANYYDLGAKAVLDFKGWHTNNMSPEQASLLGGYCVNDVDLTARLFWILHRGFPTIELALIDKTIRMYSEPSLTLDVAYLREFAEGKLQEKDDALAKLSVAIGHDVTDLDLASNPQFAALVSLLGARVPYKSSPTDPNKLIPALAKTDAGFKDLLYNDDPLVRMLAETRISVKSVLDRTRAKSLMDCGVRGALPVMLNYYGAHTGRFSGGEKLNPQNLPRNGKLRHALVAPPGYVVIACDSSQIEARITAWLAGQLDLLQQFRDYDTDSRLYPSPYEIMASTIYGRTITTADTLERFVGKTCILGLGYGMGHIKLRITLKVGQGGISVDYSEAQCQSVVEIYRNKNAKITKLWKEGDRALHTIYNAGSFMLGGKLRVDQTGILLPNKMVLGYVALEPGPDGQWGYCNTAKSLPAITLAKLRGDPYTKLLTRIYGPKVIENVVQALARIVITEQLLIIGRRYRVALQVHDENVMVVPEKEAEQATKFIKEVMTTPPTWAPDLPINCSIGIGKSYGEC